MVCHCFFFFIVQGVWYDVHDAILFCFFLYLYNKFDIDVVIFRLRENEYLTSVN